MSRLPEDEYQGLKARGYTLAREFFPFGRCEMYKNYDTGHCLYYFDGTIREWQAVAEILRNDWSPSSWEDMAWKRNNVKESVA